MDIRWVARESPGGISERGEGWAGVEGKRKHGLQRACLAGVKGSKTSLAARRPLANLGRLAVK